MAASTFAQAVEAVVNGDEAALRALLRAGPGPRATGHPTAGGPTDGAERERSGIKATV